MAEVARCAVLAAAMAVLAGCAFYGGAGTAWLDGSTLTTTSKSASIGSDGVHARSNRTVRRID